MIMFCGKLPTRIWPVFGQSLTRARQVFANPHHILDRFWRFLERLPAAERGPPAVELAALPNEGRPPEVLCRAQRDGVGLVCKGALAQRV